MGNLRSLVSLTLIASATLSACATRPDASEKPFAGLAAAYAARDPAAATRNYAPDALIEYAYDGAPGERYRGQRAIEASFRDFFARVDPADALELNFRFSERNGGRAKGVYRLKVGKDRASFGGFEVKIDRYERFAFDRSTSAERADFEDLAGPVLLRSADEELDRAYYGLLTGRYRLADGCELAVTRSVVRLFVRNLCTNSWRGLTRVSGMEWSGGDRVLPQRPADRYRFDRVSDKPSHGLALTRDGAEQVAQRTSAYTTSEIAFAAGDGTRLAGTLYVPKGAGPHPASVLVHGSGPQDRDGYASIIAVLADAFAAEGRVVLAYDKRGSGASQGNGNGAGFDLLASDASAALDFLKSRPEVRADAIGFAGSSQAGWVIARAIAQGAKPADVFLLGAAGTAFTVREQNLYNTEVRMACAGLPEDARALALAQQAAFFDALADRTKAERLDALTAQVATDPRLRDWLFPDSAGLVESDAWYTVLDPSFDPLPVWDGYRGRKHFVFSEFDDATDTEHAVERLANVASEVEVIAGAQHLGLLAASRCDGEIGDRQAFAPALFQALSRFAKGR